jgi:hypothetical protein
LDNDYKILFSKFNRHIYSDTDGNDLIYEFLMYLTIHSHYVPPIVYDKGKTISGFVNIESYGILIRIISEIDGEQIIQEIRTGSLSAQSNEVSYLLHRLCREKLRGIEHIHSIIEEESAAWNGNKWGNPFGIAAEKELIKKYRIENGKHPIPPWNKNMFLKKERMLRRYNPYRNLPGPDKDR